MRYFKVLLMILLLIFGACKKNVAENEQETKAPKRDDKIITKQHIDSLKITDYVLSNDAKRLVADWQKYQQLSTQTDFLKKGDLAFFEGNDSLPKSFLNELKSTIPQEVKTNIIKARLVAVETKLLKLNAELQQENTPRKDILKSIEEFLQAFSNLNLAINKKLELDANNISRPQ